MSKRKLESLTGLFDYGGSGSEEEQEAGSDAEDFERAGTGVVLLHDSEEEGAEPGPSGAANQAATGPLTSAVAEGGSGLHADDDAAPLAADANGAEGAGEPDDLAAILAQLPPEIREPPPGECDPAQQARVADLLQKQALSGRYVSLEVRKNRDYRNPDFLAKMVEFFEIRELGTAFDPDVFDPSALPREDFYEELAKEWAAMDEKRRAERAVKQRVEFTKSASTASLGVKNNPLLPGLNTSAYLSAVQAQAAAKAQQLTAALSKGAAVAGSGGGGGGGASRWDSAGRKGSK